MRNEGGDIIGAISVGQLTDSTVGIAEGAFNSAKEVTDCMHSISAALEQSTTNLNMIATASEEMGNTIKEIAENSARARVTTEEAVGNAQKSHNLRY